LYLLDGSTEKCNKDYLNSLDELKSELKNLVKESSGFLSMMAARSERIEFLVKVEAREDFSHVIHKTFLKTVS
ncbi:MAG: hypothetical protein Q9198_011236, partial [Flavoplaca austrocitrina]